jgi:gluconate 2-dehydrogenase gamma chain
MMTMIMDVSRRGWLVGLGVAALADIAAAQQHAHEMLQSTSPPKLEVLDPATAAEIDALTSQIIPSDDGPGAHEAGVIYFIDRALATFEHDKREAYHKGLKQVHHERLKRFPHSATVGDLTAAQQIELLKACEKSPFFELLRTHTVWGFLGSPTYGGNRDKVGWAHINFDDRMHWEAPFGYYDAAPGELRKS